jgi:zinc transport system ATP-binding protein
MNEGPGPGLELPAPLTLRLYSAETVLFASDRHWLHPLFDLEAWLAQEGRDVAGTRLVDRVTGRAAAFLVARLGIPELRTGLLSRRAIPVLERHGIAYTALETVDRIACATEDQLLTVEDGATAYGLLQERRLRASQR